MLGKLGWPKFTSDLPATSLQHFFVSSVALGGRSRQVGCPARLDFHKSPGWRRRQVDLEMFLWSWAARLEDGLASARLARLVHASGCQVGTAARLSESSCPCCLNVLE